MKEKRREIMSKGEVVYICLEVVLGRKGTASHIFNLSTRWE
jgi:hypothetical protein